MRIILLYIIKRTKMAIEPQERGICMKLSERIEEIYDKCDMSIKAIDKDSAYLRGRREAFDEIKSELYLVMDEFKLNEVCENSHT